jgi:hypothetical protein
MKTLRTPFWVRSRGCRLKSPVALARGVGLTRRHLNQVVALPTAPAVQVRSSDKPLVT